MDLNKLISGLQRDNLISPSRYTVEIYGLLNDVTNPSPDVMLNCAGIQVPGLTVTHAEDKRVGLGQIQRFVNGKELQEISMTFYESNSHKERKFFVDWIDSIFDKETKRFNFHDNIKKDIIIKQLDRAGAVIYEARLIDATPTNISPMDKSYAAVDAIPQFSASVVFNELEEIFYENGIAWE